MSINIFFSLLSLYAFILPCSSNAKSADKTSDQKQDVAFSYKTILQSYYNSIVYDLDEPAISFNQFLDYTYNSFDGNVVSSTISLAEICGVPERAVGSIFSEEAAAFYTSLSSSSTVYSEPGGGGSNGSCASYILKRSNYSVWFPIASDFARMPLLFAVDYGSTNECDIIYEEIDSTNGNFTGHVGIIVDTARPSYYGNLIMTTEAVPGGVQNGFIDDFRMVAYKCTIIRQNQRSNFTTEDKLNIIYFNNAQIGKPYSYDFFNQHYSINETEWFCSELIYASFRSENINLSSSINPSHVWPADLKDSSCTSDVSCSLINFLDLSYGGITNNRHKFVVSRGSNYPVTIKYNSLMCFENDAKKWLNLSNINTLTISSNTNITIGSNWFANSFAFSYLDANSHYRFVTYAVKSSENIFVKHNIIYYD